VAKKKKKHPEDPDDFQLKRRRTHHHIDNCSEGYMPPGSGSKVDGSYCQVHHQLPVSSLQDASIKDSLKSDPDFEVVYKCLANTTWDVDLEENVVGLPLKRAFLDKSAPKQDLWGWPCHMYGHNQYTKRVKTKLVEQVWNKAQEKAEECEVGFADIAAELKAAARLWRIWLRSRGSTASGGTEICWKERRHREGWWIPFSMDPGSPAEVRPPPTLDEFAANMKNALANLFKGL
jgi:hypothetical protein